MNQAHELSRAQRWAVRRFAGRRAEYYEDLANLLEFARDMRQQQIFEQDAQRYAGTARGVLSQLWAQRYLDSGANLAQTWQGTLPDDEVAIIRVQQDLGSQALIAALKDLAKTARIRRQLRSAAMASLGVGLMALTIALLAVTLMPIWAVGTIKSSFQIPPSEWGRVGVKLAHWAGLMQTYGLYLLAVLCVAITWVVWSIHNWTGPGRDRADRSILLYQAGHEIAAMQFALTMTTLTRKGTHSMLTLKSAMEVLSGSVHSRWAAWQLARVGERIEETGGVDVHIFATGILTQEMQWRLEDLSVARPLHEAFEVIAQNVQELWLPRLVQRMAVWRWVLLIAAVVIVIGVVFSFQVTTQEMKTVVMNHLSV